jgi:transposase
MTATQAKWVERVRGWKTSGLSATDYARGRGFAAATLAWWSSRIRVAGLCGEVATSTSSSQVRMARVVRAAAPSSSINVRVGGANLEVRAGFDPALLREVVEALGGSR